MTSRSFKSISVQELENALAAAISALTNTETTISVLLWKETDNKLFSSKDTFEIQLSVAAGKSYEGSKLREGDAVPTPGDTDIPF